MILSAIDVVELQYFLMDGARRYVVATGELCASADELLASAAALDYALLLSSEGASESIDDSAPVACTIRATMARAARAALDLVATILDACETEFVSFAKSHGSADGIFGTLASLRARGAIVDDDITFRALTLANDVMVRRERLGRT